MKIYHFTIGLLSDNNPGEIYEAASALANVHVLPHHVHGE